MIPLAGLLRAVATYATVRWHDLVLRRWADVDRVRQRRLKRFLRRDLPRASFYRDHAGAAPALADLPVIDKAMLMASFGAFNRAGVTAEEAWRAFEGDRRIGTLTVGASTGTSGNRGLFVIDEAERFRWLGAILGKALPGFWTRHRRIAVILPLATRLYETANASGRLSLRFFDVTLGPAAWADALDAFAPDVIIASPKILRWLAGRAGLKPERVFSAAETLDPVDRAVIEARFGRPLGQIYMATEGLIAVSCRDGTLHLCDDTMFIELEPARDGLVTPVITDVSRRTQIMARYRMNDLLRMAPEPCRCGSPLRAVAEIVGRNDDVFRLAAGDGAIAEITPDALRNAIVGADRRIDDYRLIQVAIDAVELHVAPELADAAADAAQRAVADLLARRGAKAGVTLHRRALTLDPSRKLRRVENRHD